MSRLVVWTNGYSPFIMGGDVHGPIGTEIEVGERFDLGRGFFGYLVASPISGKTYVAEATTGAFVGPSLKVVRADVESGEPEDMREQVEEAAERRKKVRMLAPDDFWKRFK